MTAKTVLITGCSRGIGLGLVKEFLSRKYNVIATCRRPEKSAALNSLLENAGQPTAFACDVSSDKSIEDCKSQVSNITSSIDILINNAGISNKDHPEEPPSKMERDEFLHIMNTNVAGVCVMTQAFLPLLLKSESPKVINIGSGLGSIELADNLNCISYRCSKTALNMLSKVFSLEFKNIIFATVHPGWVQTDMGSSKNRKPPVTVDESVKGITDLTEKITAKETGIYFSYKGEKMPF